MDWSGPWWIFVLAFAILLLIGTAIYARRTRNTGFHAVTAGLGFTRFQGPIPFTSEERKGFNLFSRGSGRKWTNIFADRLDDPFTVFFDFSYRFGMRFIASVNYHQSVAAFSARLANLPDFQLTPATSLDRIAPKLGFRAVRFDSRPEFGKRYWLRAADEITVRAFFSDRFLDRLSAADPKQFWYVEKSGQWLLVYRHGALIPPQQFSIFMQETRAIANLFLVP